jgi:hypothetical protein
MQKDFTMTLLVDRTPEDVFNAVCNVRGWWQGLYEEEIKGETKKINDEFTFRAGGGAHYTRQKLVDVVPNKRVVWLVTESELTFIDKKDEWKGTRIAFEISAKKDKTELRFTHQGLTPAIECYDACSSAWSAYLTEKLLTLLKQPNKN